MSEPSPLPSSDEIRAVAALVDPATDLRHRELPSHVWPSELARRLRDLASALERGDVLVSAEEHASLLRDRELLAEARLLLTP